MLYATKGTVQQVRQCFDQAQFKLVSVNALASISTKPANAFESEYVDGLIISGAEFDSIQDKQAFINSIDESQHLYVITNKSYAIVNDKVTFLIEDNTRIKNYFEKLNISPIQIDRVKVGISTVNVHKEETKEEQSVPLQPVEEVKEDIVITPNKEVDTPKVEREISLTNIQMSDIVRVALIQNDKVKMLKPQLEELGLRLRKASITDIDVILDKYLICEDELCIEIVNEFKKIIHDIYHKYTTSIQTRVDDIYNEVCSIVNKQLYGLDPIEVDKLLEKRNTLLNNAISLLKKICVDYSNVDRVSSDLVYMLQKFSFEDGLDKLPFIYDKDTFSEARFTLYKQLIEFKVSLKDEDGLKEKLEVAIATLEETNNLTDRIMQARINNKIINIAGYNYEYIVNTGFGIFTAVKLAILKFKTFSRIPIVCIDATGLYKNDIEKYYNAVEYVSTNNIAEAVSQVKSTKSDANIIVISSVNSVDGIRDAEHIIIPTDVANYLRAVSFYEKIISIKQKVVLLVTPCDYDTGVELKAANKVIVPYIADLAKNSLLSEIIDNQQLFSIVSQLR